MNLTYYKIRFTLISPLAVGSGANCNTDKDVTVDSNGNPFIPATAIAGVLRSYIKNSFPEKENEIFGSLETESDSKVRFYDAICNSEKNSFFITSRDCVHLADKVAVNKEKFNMEAVETGASFECFVELLCEDFAPYLEAALAALHSGRIALGSKTSRGYGRVNLSIRKLRFTSAKEWLDFDMFDDSHWEGTDEISVAENITSYDFSICLRPVGGISIREYTTEILQNGGYSPDYKSMYLHSVKENGETVAVIPGTSWAGAFRSRFSEVAGEELTEKIFGFVRKNTKENQKSKIRFSESKLSGGTYKILSRNAINRFSGATKDGALYTEKTYYYGKTKLEISFSELPQKEALFALGVCLADLHNGFLAVGGLSSVGRGLFEIDSIEFNKKTLSAENIINGNIEGFVGEVTV